ncbi:MAG: rhomboid family intramembrane serine protease [Myxococcota bacterium]
MIPLRDDNPSRHVPIANLALIGLCTLGFVTELRSGPELAGMLDQFGLVPARFLSLWDRSGGLSTSLWTPFLSSLFLHAGWLHVGGNMLYLWIFGDNVEDWLGPGRYLLFYLGGGVAAGLAHVAANPGSVVPTVGASGAIAAVMGAYLVLYPHARVQSLILVVIFVRILPIPAWVYLGIWFAQNLLYGSATLNASSAIQGGVAWWAHAGGFAFGALVALTLGRRPFARG